MNRKGGCHCIIVIKYGLPVFEKNCDIYGNALTMALCWPVASLAGIHQCMSTHALTFTKHRHPMFNY